jgi:predicted RNA methylase
MCYHCYFIEQNNIKETAMTRNQHHSPHYEHGDKGNFDMAYHLEMISDHERSGLLQKGIDKLVNEDMIFCDLGCGTGVFSIHAARKAKKVYSVEYDENILEVARKNIEMSGLSEKITLISDLLTSAIFR